MVSAAWMLLVARVRRAEVCILGRPPLTALHTAATWLLNGGRDARAIQAWLGHADIRTTLGYTHATPTTQETTADAMHVHLTDAMARRKS